MFSHIPEGPIYIAMKLPFEPVECWRVHEPIDGWSWLRCEDVDSLFREVVRTVKHGYEPPILSVQGPVDLLRVEDLKNLVDPVIEGCLRIRTSTTISSSSKLFELASLVRIRLGPLTVVACFRGVKVAELLRYGIIPLIWEPRRL
jgi:hypothetical protein